MTNEEFNMSIKLVARADKVLAESDFEAFGKQCGKFIKAICGVCHDRFANVGDKEVFWSNTSLKDEGRLTFGDKMVGEIIPGLLAPFHKTMEQREYGKSLKLWAEEKVNGEKNV